MQVRQIWVLISGVSRKRENRNGATLRWSVFAGANAMTTMG